MSRAPVILFVYARPDHTRRTLEALSRNVGARETVLWVFSDGPKNERAAEKVAEVRALICEIAGKGWFADVVIREAPQNRGLAASTRAGVTEVMAAHNRAIVLEDDLVTAPDFLSFMNDCLDFYEADPTVGAISGYSPLREMPKGYAHDIYAVPRTCSTGWATWADRWAAIDWSASRYPAFRRDRRLRRAFDACGSDRGDRLRRELESGAESWSIRFGFSQFMDGRNTIFAARNRILNIGDDGSGVHNAMGATYNADIPDEPLAYRLEHVTPDPRIVAALHRNYSGSRASRLARWLRNNGLAGVERSARGAYRLFQTLRLTKSV